jgi:MFS family permease
VSSLFVIWSLTSFVLEVPSGAWADTVDRRRLLVASAAVHGLGFGSWLLFPGYAGFAAGFVLWGLSSAMMSGTFESLLYDELVARDAEADYPRLVGQAHSAAMAANLVASLAAAPLFAWGGYPLVGWASVAAAGAQAVLAATLPVTTHRRHRSPTEVLQATETVLGRYVGMLRAGVAEASRAVDVRRAVLLSALVVGASAYDEYFPLVARAHHVPTAVVPWLVGLVVLGQAVGTLLAGRTAGMAGPTMGRLLLGAAVLISAGALVAPVVGFAAIAVGYGLLNNAMVVAEARLQQVITGPARATVTSVAGLGQEVVALAVYAGFAAGAGVVEVPVLVAALGVPLALVALLARRRVPAPETVEAPVGGPGRDVDSAPWLG